MQKNTEISERIKQLLEYLNVNANEFSRKLEYNRAQTVYDVINAKSAPSFDFFNRLFNSEYSDKINPVWLFTGRGSIEIIEKKSDNVDEIKAQLTIELKREKKDQVLKLVFGDNNLEILNR